MKNVFLSVPTRGAINWQTVTRLEEIRDAHPDLRPILYQPGNLSVALTRNTIVRAFLATDCDVLVMVDDDVVPPPHFLASLLPFLPEYAMVGVPHVMPTPGRPSELGLTAYNLNGDGDLVPAQLTGGMNEVDAIATGCVAIARLALAYLAPAPFRMAHDPDEAITSDDFLFCNDIRGVGKIGTWWDGWYCDHVTTVALAPLMEAILRERSSMTGAKT